MLERKELAVVVGATGAFGVVIVEKLLSQGLGVLAVGRSREELNALSDRHRHVVPCIADISEDASVDTIRMALDRPVRIAVHGPGAPVAGGVLTAPVASLMQAVNTKAGGMLRLTRAVESQMKAHSRLVAIGGHYGLEPTAYAASAGIANAALLNLVRQISLAYGKRGITAHLISPGPADTARLRNVAKERAAERNVSIDLVLEELKEESSIGALTTPEQVAWAIATLLDPCADAMNGSTIMLDSGRRRGLP